MIKVKVFPLPGCDTSSLDDKSWLEIEDGSTVSDVLKKVHISKLKAKLLLVSVNGERASLSRELFDGDVVGFFIPVAGG